MWCDLGCRSRTNVVIKAAAQTRLYLPISSRLGRGRGSHCTSTRTHSSCLFIAQYLKSYSQRLRVRAQATHAILASFSSFIASICCRLIAGACYIHPFFSSRPGLLKLRIYRHELRLPPVPPRPSGCQCRNLTKDNDCDPLEYDLRR